MVADTLGAAMSGKVIALARWDEASLAEPNI